LEVNHVSTLRVRFAPSPTGFLHIGGAHTALFNWLVARGQGGKFILRIEDTDKERSTDEATQGILDGLSWLGLNWDEGPFYQSRRGELYAKALADLAAAGRSYKCYCSPEELDERRQAAMKSGAKPKYDGRCRSLTSAQSDRAPAIRLKAHQSGTTHVRDLIRGNVAFDNAELDDLILARADGSPTYNFCVVVDDADMRISHVIRGEDHLSNTPKQVQIYEALKLPLPAFAHVGLLHGVDKQKLSKRHGAISVTAYKEMGFLREAVVNYLARLGWGHGDQEVFTEAELIEHFRIEDVGKAPAVFNPEKLGWLNQKYIAALSAEALGAHLAEFLAPRGFDVATDARLPRVVATLRERAKTLVELAAQAEFYFAKDVVVDAAAQAKFLTLENAPLLTQIRDDLASAPAWDVATLEARFRALVETTGKKLGDLAQPTRVALSGRTASPGLFEIMEILGRDVTLARLARAAEIANKPS
jgi:glutamyl-tRNA synthetase